MQGNISQSPLKQLEMPLEAARIKSIPPHPHPTVEYE